MTRRLAYLLGITIPSLIGFLFAVSQLPYEPDEPLTLARSFVDSLARGSYAEAFAMTAQRAETGRTLEEFTAFAQRQFGPSVPGGVRAERARGMLPRQSYGNRFRRWVMGRAVDPDSVSLDYVLRGEKLYLLFEVRFTRGPDGHWLISYFQSHAG